MASAKYNKVIGLGVALIIISVLASGGLYIFAIKREIKAFSVQQKMPLYQEGIEKMTPTVAKASGTMGKEVAKGITEGIKEGLNNNQEPNNKE